MMKKLFLLIFLSIVTLTAMAVPAKPGLWRTLLLADGSEVQAQLRGDEHVHFWMAGDGSCYVEQGDSTFVRIDEQQLRARSLSNKRGNNPAAARMMARRKVDIGQRTHYMGRKKGLVILVEFSNLAFRSGNTPELYQRVMNEENLREGNFRGSVADYFKAQSGGLFELEFDVVGPYKLSRTQSYYGSNNSNGDDMHADDMIIEACNLANDSVDFSTYDWDEDGEADQVFVLYAGKGEADGGSANTIWPHMWTLDEAGRQLTLDNVKINTYACSNEIDSYSRIEGIGVFCHEFSHCLGFPDFYDIIGNHFGMGSFDLMCAGSYNGNGFIPCGYTAHEKMMCGWQEPIVLGDKDVEVDYLRPMSDNGDTYIIYNDAHPDEYYMIENRQKSGWDTSYPAKGLMITHVDFDKEIWENNIPNTIISNYQAMLYEMSCSNDHQRMTLFHADNTESSYSASTDLYPYQQLDSLTATSRPAATLFNANSRGSKTMLGSILNIRQNSNGIISFTYRAPAPEATPDTTQTQEDILFYESFDQCMGTGGNDELWSGQVANSVLKTDNEGWTAERSYGANQCARFGTSKIPGMAVTPEININGEAVLSFKAAQWGTDGSTLDLSVSDGTITPAMIELPSEEWGTFTAHIQAYGPVQITFLPQKRLFLDEVTVTRPGVVPSAVRYIAAEPQHAGQVFDLQGRLMGREPLKKGIYIKNGKKIIIK